METYLRNLKCYILFIELNTTNISSTLESGVDEQLIFNVWDTLLTIELPDPSWVSYQINEMKILAYMELSSLLEYCNLTSYLYYYVYILS